MKENCESNLHGQFMKSFVSSDLGEMMGDPKAFSKMIVSFAIVTLLSFCSPASSFAFLPRVSRTNDAIVIDCIKNYFHSLNFNIG